MANNYEIDRTPTVERHRDNRMAMIVAGAIIVVAIIAAAFYFSNQPQQATLSAADQSNLAAQQSALTAQQAANQANTASTQAQVAGATAQGNAVAAQQANLNANPPAGVTAPQTINPPTATTGDTGNGNSSSQ